MWLVVGSMIREYDTTAAIKQAPDETFAKVERAGCCGKSAGSDFSAVVCLTVSHKPNTSLLS
jgi:hypothetical protein